MELQKGVVLSSEEGGAEQEVPAHLVEGWEIFKQWAEAREAAGDPLPPGGTILLQRESILREELTALFHRVVRMLRVPEACVRIDLNRAEDGRLYPAIAVDPPPKWLHGIQFANAPDGQTVRQMAQTYIRGVLDSEYARMKASYESRSAHLDRVRADLVPEVVIDGLTEAAPG